jgi:hypothetical protein
MTMKSSILSVAAVAVTLAFAGSSRAQERLDIDPALQGIWKVHAISTDGGRSIEYTDGKAFARVSATQVRFLNGNTYEVQRVRIFTDAKGQPGNMILLTNGELLEVTKDRGQPFVRVRVLNLVNGEVTEMGRFVISVEK